MNREASCQPPIFESVRNGFFFGVTYVLNGTEFTLSNRRVGFQPSHYCSHVKQESSPGKLLTFAIIVLGHFVHDSMQNGFLNDLLKHVLLRH